MRGLMGSFSLMPLQDVTDLLARREISGSLTCERGTVRKTIHLRAGEAVGAASNDPREFLGQLLMNFGHISEEQLTKAFQTQEQTKVRLGKVLVMVGVVQAETIREVLAIKIRETILDAFLWDSGVFHVDDGPAPHSDDLDVTVSMADIVKEAEFRATAWNAFRAQFPTGAASLIIDEAKIPPATHEDTVDGKLLMMAIEGKTIDEIGLALHATDFHLYQRLYALARQGVLSPAPIRVVPPGAASETLAAAELLEQARSLLAAERYDDAAGKAARAIEAAPGLEAARAVLADAQRALLGRLRTLLEPSRVPVLRLSAHEVARVPLSSPERYLLSRCDGQRELRRIAQVAPLSELEVLRAFRGFLEAGLVELH
jgi:hypothetical protein